MATATSSAVIPIATDTNPSKSRDRDPSTSPHVDPTDKDNSSCRSRGDDYAQFNTNHTHSHSHSPTPSNHSTSSYSPIPKDSSPPPPQHTPSPPNPDQDANSSKKSETEPLSKGDDTHRPEIDDNLSNSVISMNSTSTANTKQSQQTISSGTVYLDIDGPFPYFDDQPDLKQQQPLDTVIDSETEQITEQNHGHRTVDDKQAVDDDDDDEYDDDHKSAMDPESPDPDSENEGNEGNEEPIGSTEIDENESEEEEEENSDLSQDEVDKLEHRTLSNNGYLRTTFIARTLQGEVFNGKMRVHRLVSCDSALSSDSNGSNSSDEVDGRRVVIKKTSKKLHALGITITKTGKRIKVQENIVAEADLLQHFHANQPPSSLIEFIDFFQDSHHYYLVMEHGGSDYFDFIVKCHELILKGQLTLSEWRKHCKFMFAQMVQFIRWMHEVMHCANLDISLENMLISDLAHFDPDSKTLKKCYIKFIDFGLTEFFDLKRNPDFVCTKYVGKTHYKAPKVYGKKKQFMANQADIWSLGVCLFMMIIGAPPYNKPIDKDITFQYVKYKQIAKLLQEWGRIKYVTSNLHDLLTRMMCVDEEKRITMQEIVRHPWIRHYFPADNVTKPTQPPLGASKSVNISHREHTKRRTARSASSTTSSPYQSPKIQHRHSHHAHSPPHHYKHRRPAAVQIPQSPNSNPLDGASSPHYQPTSPSCTPRGSISSGSGPGAALNIMIPQMAAPSASGSVMTTPSPSRQSRGASMSSNASSFVYPQISHRYSSPYSPYSPVSPAMHSPHHGVTAPPPPSQANPSPITPIMQSRTSKHDSSVYYASIDGHDKPKVRRVQSENALSILNRTGPGAGTGAKKSVSPGPPHHHQNQHQHHGDAHEMEKGKASKRKKSKKFFSKISLPIFGGH